MNQLSVPDTYAAEPDKTAEEADASPVPRITIHAFCESPELAGTLEIASGDRRMQRAHLQVRNGGVSTARDLYRASKTPNLVILETGLLGDQLLNELDDLSEVCDVGTRVLIVGHKNDVETYRELVSRGVSDYLIAPLTVMETIKAISSVYLRDRSDKLGKVYAFVGAKGGVGSSTIAHNVAWLAARDGDAEVVLADLDLPFGTVGLDFNLDPAQGIGDIIFGSERLDGLMLDRLLAPCKERLNLLAAPANLDDVYDLDETIFDHLIDVLQSNIPISVLDIPNVWNGWAKRALLASDEIILTAAPDLSNLRNAKNLLDVLRQDRPNDKAPRLVLNQVNVPKRPEISPDEFADALQLEVLAVIDWEPKLFGTAANNGETIVETSGRHPATDAIKSISEMLIGLNASTQKMSGLMGLLSRMRGTGKNQVRQRA